MHYKLVHIHVCSEMKLHGKLVQMPKFTNVCQEGSVHRALASLSLAFDTLVPHDFSADIIHGSNNLALVILDIFRGQIVDEVFK